MTLLAPPKNKIIPLEIANVIIETHDSTLNILEEASQIYGKALDGSGKVVYKNGNQYEGAFENGMLHGNGVFTWANSVRYEGEFRHNQITGIGRYDWPDGSWYEGQVQLGLRHGSGKFATPGEDCIYEGEWKDGLKHGEGVMTFKTGTVYEGLFERGLKHGFGKMSYPSGNYYEGEWAFDKKEGEGTMYWVDLNEKYNGSWGDNKQDGWGTHIWLEIKGDGKFLRNRYEGEWRNGMRNGVGVFYYSNGSKYEGGWIDNFKEGFAVFTYEDGRVFKGLFKNDKMVTSSHRDPKYLQLDFNATQQSHIHIALADVSVLKKQNTLGPNDTQGSGRKLNKKQTTVLQDKPADSNKDLLRLNEVEANPYDNMLDIADLFVEEDEEALMEETSLVKNLLLRHHSKLKDLYRLYTSKQQSNPEESFALSFRMFWKMLRDTRVLSPKISIAAFDRLFLQGAKNNFGLHTTQQVLRKSLYLAKRNYIELLTEHELNTFDVPMEDIPEEELFASDDKTDVHDENRILFFRHFVDGIVRVAYLKYGGMPDFSKHIERVLAKVEACLEPKKKHKHQIEEEQLIARVRNMSEPFREKIKALFQQFPTKDQAFLFGSSDYTMTVKNILSLFEKLGLIKEDSDKEIVLQAVERTFDPEECYSLPVAAEITKEKSSSSRSPADRMQKLSDLLASETIFLEFHEILLLTLFRKDGSTVKEEEAKKRIAAFVKNFEQSAKEKDEDIEDAIERGPKISWPYSEKDYMFDHLTTEKEKREREYAALRQKKIERENEEKEARAMEKEDIDIDDQYLRPPSKQSVESGEYAESYNDF